MSQPDPPQDVHALRDRAELEERLARRQELVNGLRGDLAAHRLELENLRTTLATRDAELVRMEGQSNRPKCLYCTFGEDADFTVEDLKEHIESECDLHPMRQLKASLRTLLGTMNHLGFVEAGMGKAHEAATRAARQLLGMDDPPVATMLNTPITAAERDRISKDGP